MRASAGTSDQPPLRPPALPFRGTGLPRSTAYVPWGPPNLSAGSHLSATKPSSIVPPPPSASLPGPPPRPVSSSWHDRSSEGQSTNSDPIKPLHMVVDMEDPEEVEGAAGEFYGGPEEEMGVARQLARAAGAERFFDAFHERCPSGHASAAGLSEILAAVGLTVPTEELQRTMAQLFPKVDIEGPAPVPYAQCQEVYLHLLADQRRSVALQELGPSGCVARWMATDTGATNLLLVIVISLCSVSAFLAAGVAILMLFLDGLDTIGTHLQEDLRVVQDTLEVFASQIATQTQNEQTSTFVTTLSVVLEYIGYIASIKTEGSDILKMATSISNCMSAWLTTGPEKAFVALALLAAALGNTTVARYGLDQTLAVFNGVNAGGMTTNYEVALARWRNSTPNTAVEYLTAFRYAAQCPKSSGCVTNATVAAPMISALSGSTFAQYVMDYRATSAFAGFTSVNGLGVEVQVSSSGFTSSRFRLIQTIMQTWTSDSTNSYEYLVARVTTPGVGTLLVPPQNCTTACQQLIVSPGWPMYNAMLGLTGVMQFVNHRGAKAIAAYTTVSGQPLALVVQMELTDITKGVLAAIVATLTRLNTQYAQNSQEFELSTFQVRNGNVTITHLTPYRFASECLTGQCVETPYVRLAAGNCSAGVLTTTDYRGVPVLVGYSCISELSAVVSVKSDVKDNEADTLQAILEAVNARTAKDTATSAKFLLATPNSGLTADEVTGYGDFQIRSNLKYPDSCVNPNCTWNSMSALLALQDETNVIQTLDYRNVAVKAAPSRSTALSYAVGLALETDSHELWQPVVDTAWKVAVFAAGMVVLSTLVLVLTTKVFLRSMISAKEEGKRAVEKEKDRFSKLVSSMYPAYVVPQLLEGEKQMVCEVPAAAVFFSDIHEFTSVSNAMGSKELLTLMGYVYGVMDHIADRFEVYKVKTIGDAYLAVHGLPGTTSSNVSLDLLRFASCVCQVFGDRFVHPTEGQVLAAMNKAMQWNGRTAPKAKCSSLGSVATSAVGGGKAGSGTQSVAAQSQRSAGRLGSKASASVAESGRQPLDAVRCVMSYGLAMGKLVAGVLAGRCPMFDIWGTPVNLASRMQSTGEPGRIQVSEQLYQRVVAVSGQPFSFEGPRSVVCKGFGAVNAYLVRATAEGLPKDLQMELRLEPRYGEFFFTNILAPAPAGPQLGQALG
eukprot:EG_transcript_355